MTSRARELTYTDQDRLELGKRCTAVRRLAHQWRKRSLDEDAFRGYLAEMASATERLYAWIDELWLYGTGGRQAFDDEVAADDSADLGTLSPAQLARRHNRERWSSAAALAARLAGEAHAAGDQDEARRLKGAFVRTVIPWLPAGLQSKDIMLDRAALITMLRGDRPTVLVAVSLDEHPEFADRYLPKVVPRDDPLEFPPATATCRRIGLFAEPRRLADNGNGQEYPHIEIRDRDGQDEG